MSADSVAAIVIGLSEAMRARLQLTIAQVVQSAESLHRSASDLSIAVKQTAQASVASYEP